MSDLREVDKAYMTRHSLDYLIGVDEAGRGPLAGPVVACAVTVRLQDLEKGYEPKHPFGYITDSKKVTARRRQAIFDAIYSSSETVLAKTYAVPASVIDSINILEATKLAWQEAVEQCLLSISPDARVGIVIDGNIIYPDDLYRIEAVIKGDSQYWSIALASIIAKVTRDTWISEQAERYPEYGFSQHKGYGTEYHRQAIQEFGLTAIHRKSFCSKWL